MAQAVHTKVANFKNSHPLISELYHLIFVVAGGMLAALGLEAFLILGIVFMAIAFAMKDEDEKKKRSEDSGEDEPSTGS